MSSDTSKKLRKVCVVVALVFTFLILAGPLLLASAVFNELTLLQLLSPLFGPNLGDLLGLLISAALMILFLLYLSFRIIKSSFRKIDEKFLGISTAASRKPSRALVVIDQIITALLVIWFSVSGIERMSSDYDIHQSTGIVLIVGAIMLAVTQYWFRASIINGVLVKIFVLFVMFGAFAGL